jgi:hypothetical protein
VLKVSSFDKRKHKTLTLSAKAEIIKKLDAMSAFNTRYKWAEEKNV